MLVRTEQNKLINLPQNSDFQVEIVESGDCSSKAFIVLRNEKYETILCSGEYWHLEEILTDFLNYFEEDANTYSFK